MLQFLTEGLEIKFSSNYSMSTGEAFDPICSGVVLPLVDTSRHYTPPLSQSGIVRTRIQHGGSVEICNSDVQVKPQTIKDF